MNRARYFRAAAVAMVAAAIGCTNDSVSESATGSLKVRIQASPGDVTSIHVSVTSPDFLGSVDADLIQQPDLSWVGSVLDVPPGPGRTVKAEAFDVDHHNTYEGVANNVTVLAGELTNVALALKPIGTGNDTGVNTPPHFVSLLYPDAILSNETATFFATADDPDANTQLTYSWSVLQGGGSFSSYVAPNQTPGTAVSTVYTPSPGFTGFAVVQVSATDGLATSATTFPLAVGAGINPLITFDTPPDVTISSIERQNLMPGGNTQIQYLLSNPVQPWTPATMHVHTSWSDSCGGTFSLAPEDIDINQSDTVSRTVTYTAPASHILAVESCKLTLSVLTPSNVESKTTINTWIEPPMVMFVSSSPVTGNTFNGSWASADAFCQNLADSQTAVVPTGTYRALLGFDAISAKDRLVDAPFVRVDGTPIARSKAELFSLNLLNAVRTDEHNAFNGTSAVFTGTSGDGSKGSNCLNWTSSDVAETATAGVSTVATNPGWTSAGSFTCDTQLPIYCVQQPSPN